MSQLVLHHFLCGLQVKTTITTQCCWLLPNPNHIPRKTRTPSGSRVSNGPGQGFFPLSLHVGQDTALMHVHCRFLNGVLPTEEHNNSVVHHSNFECKTVWPFIPLAGKRQCERRMPVKEHKKRTFQSFAAKV